MKLTLLTALLLLTGCASFNNKAYYKRVEANYIHLIYKDSVFNNCNKCDSLRIERDKKLNRYDYARHF